MPSAPTIRGVVRNLRWWATRLVIDLPPVPPHPRSFLFVCLGNICRSPFAAAITSAKLAASGTASVMIGSAGLRPSPEGVPAAAHDAARAFGVSLAGHAPSQLTAEMIAAYDVVVVMEARQLQQVRSQFAGYRDRVVLLPWLDDAAGNAYERLNISDPYGRGSGEFMACYARIDRSVETLLAVGGIAVAEVAGPGRR